MLKRILNRFKGDRKYFTIVFFVLVLILVSGITAPLLIEKTETNWNKELSIAIQEIENDVFKSFKEKEHQLIEVKTQLTKKLHRILKPGNQSYGLLIKTVNNKEFEDYSVEVFAPNAKLIAWNSIIAIPQEELFPLSYPFGETYFYESGLQTYLSVIDTLHIDTDIFFVAFSVPFEKHYSFLNEYYKEISFTKEISDKYYTQFEIDYVPYTQKSKDGRKYSFDILNNKFNKIGLVSFLKPSLSGRVNSINNSFSQIQSLLALMACIFIGLGFRKDFSKINSRFIRLILFTLYITALRAILFLVEFPSRFLEGAFVDPSNFSSPFGWGIVKSPMELFVTSILLLIVGIKTFQYLTGYLSELTYQSKKKFLRFIFLFLSIVLSLLVIRGFAASVKSVVFDSALRYFRGTEIIPAPEVMLMSLNILLIGTAVAFLISPLIGLVLRYIKVSLHLKQGILVLLIFIFLQVSGQVFLIVQKQPLLTPLLMFVLITVLYLLAYHLCFVNTTSLYNYVYAGLAGSIISISLLNYFNLELERESLKTTTFEITRSDDNLVKFLLEESLSEASTNPDVVGAFPKRNTNFDALAFAIWSKSSMQRESLISAITLFDRNGDYLGSFSAGMNAITKLPQGTSIQKISGITLTENVPDDDTNLKLFDGIVPVTEGRILLGYISGSIQYATGTRSVADIPEFLRSKKNLVNSVIDYEQLNIFRFSDSKLVEASGEIYPSREQTQPVLKADFTGDNEAWLNLNMNDENYLTYAYKTEYENSTNIISVSVREKHFTWNLFNFFKIFITQSIFILLLLLIIIFSNRSEFRYSFKNQLLVAFLFVSIIPVGLLALYNREIVQERTTTSIINELNERTNYIENHINTQLTKHKDRNLQTIFENVSKELKISYTVFDGTAVFYNSQPGYYRAGLFNSRINSDAYYFLNYLSYREFFLKETIDNYSYDSFYKRVNINGTNYVLNVTDAFNKIKVTFSTIDVDVFLFGVYSFAVLIIIIISTIMANRISAPVRRLTKAAEAVANGDLSIQLEGNERGEIKELFDRFNMMTGELQKNQVELAELERENAWKEMAKQVAHEIKNPLTPMKLAVQQLMASFREKKNFDQLFEKISQTILNQIDTLNLIASEFSSFARMPSYKLEQIDIVPVINDVINLFVEERIKINFEHNFESVIIEGDKSNFRRMFINLVRNSIQANADSININLIRIEDQIIVYFKDNGTGIPESIRGKIFEQNFTTKEKGMGIGLKLIKRFLEGIGGSILLDDSDKGTTFKILLPIKNKNADANG
ncbi:MAG: HAMP domain-containing protein [Ignavibacteriales bacterium]|nr:MAG: HAMP domain-containing protein [Ignavibacteriales bacterium]